MSLCFPPRGCQRAAVSHGLLPTLLRALPRTWGFCLQCPELVGLARQGSSVAHSGLETCGCVAGLLALAGNHGEHLHRITCKSDSMLKVNLSLVVGNLLLFFTFPAFLTSPTPWLFVLLSLPEEASGQLEEGCPPALPWQPHQLDLKKY